MAIFEMTQKRLEPVARTTFAGVQVRERDDLQRLLRDQIEVVAGDVLLIAEEFGNFDRANRRIDLLGVDRQGRLVVIELKRTEDAGHSELQALRYAAMVSAMTFDQVVEQRELFALERGIEEGDSRSVVRTWVGGEEALGDDVRIVLVSSDFGVELTTSVLWLSERHDLDITCVRVVPYLLEERLLLDVQQLIPLPEAADYQVGVRRKEAEARHVTGTTGRDFTRYQLLVDGTPSESLSKQQAVKRAVALLVDRGVAFPLVREAVGNRWRAVSATNAEAVAAPGFATENGLSRHFWLDAPYPDELEPGKWWVMIRVGGTETEAVLERLRSLLPDVLGWQRAEAG
ncbi:MAG: hypothetical protein JWL79_141 [Frankiales bacterium]|nr:hypothetical protein [Frankiales bacterium]